jgi:hypothetical protein
MTTKKSAATRAEPKRHNKPVRHAPTPQQTLAANYVTHEAQVEVIADLLKHIAFTPGQTYLPSDGFYNNTTAMVGELQAWLGIQDYTISVLYEPDLHSAYTYALAGNKLLLYIRAEESTSTYGKAAMIAGALGMFFAEQKLYIVPSETSQDMSMIDVVGIYLGLGVVVMNGMQHSSSWVDERFQNYNLRRAKQPLNPSPTEYALQVESYLKRYNHSLEEIAGSLAPWTHRFISPQFNLVRKDVHQKSAPVRRAEAQRFGRNTSHVAMLMLTVFSMVFGVYVLSQREQKLPPELLAKREALEVLKHQHELCIKSVQEKQAIFTTDDIFLERTINADIARCTSIRNRYNYEVGEFNKAIE